MLLEIFLLLPAILGKNAMKILQFANKVCSCEFTDTLCGQWIKRLAFRY